MNSPRAVSTRPSDDACPFRQWNAPRRAPALVGHKVEEARSRGWDTLKNGELLAAAEAAGFDVFVTTDRNIQHQQNLIRQRLAIVILSKGRWKLIRLKLEAIHSAVSAATPGSVFEVEI